MDVQQVKGYKRRFHNTWAVDMYKIYPESIGYTEDASKIYEENLALDSTDVSQMKLSQKVPGFFTVSSGLG